MKETIKYNEIIKEANKPIPKILYHYSSAYNIKRIELSGKLKANSYNKICCTTLPNFYNFETNEQKGRLVIDTDIIKNIYNIKIYRKSSTDSDYIESEKEYIIDLTDCIDKFISIKDNNIKIEYSPKLHSNSTVSNIIKQKLINIEKQYKA